MSPTFEFDGKKYKKASRHQKEWGSCQSWCQMEKLWE